jgi:hypothetical protein
MLLLKMAVFWDVEPCSLDVSEVQIRLHSTTSQKTVIFILSAVRTLNLIMLLLVTPAAVFHSKEKKKS